jgi:peptidase M42 family hydrolase
MNEAARSRAPEALPIDGEYLTTVMARLLETPSPSGYTDQIVHLTCDLLAELGVDFELTRRGSIRATLPGKKTSPDRAIVAHLDTIGAMVKQLKPNGRLELVPIGHWSSRFAEGARATLFCEQGARRGTILPLKASGHTFNEEVDSQPVAWGQVELRLDELSEDRGALESLGVGVGDFVAIDPQPEFTPAGFIVSRHLDNKAGVAALLTAIKAVRQADADLPLDVHPLFTISEEVGSGASGQLHQDCAEMVAIDTAPQAEGQESLETHVTIGVKDSSGPFDYHLTQHLMTLCREERIPFLRDVFRYYRCDAAAAVEAGNDIRTGVVCFGTDATHGYERTHVHAVEGVTRLLTAYMQSEPVVARDRKALGPAEGFPTQPLEEAPHPGCGPLRAKK